MVKTPRKLEALGFRYVEDETYREPQWPGWWRGIAEPISPVDIDGQPYEGIPLKAPTKAELDIAAIEYVRAYVANAPALGRGEGC